jgi:hypothetical protein
VRHSVVEGEIGHRGWADGGLDAGAHSRAALLRHVNPTRITLLQTSENTRSTARRVGGDQAPDVDVALGDHAIERSKYLLVGILAVTTPPLLPVSVTAVGR